MDSWKEVEIYHLKRQNSRLWIACTILGFSTLLLFSLANQPQIKAGYDDYSVRYSPGIFRKNYDYIRCYYSNDWELWVVGFKDTETDRWHEIGWTLPPSLR